MLVGDRAMDACERQQYIREQRERIIAEATERRSIGVAISGRAPSPSIFPPGSIAGEPTRRNSNASDAPKPDADTNRKGRHHGTSTSGSKRRVTLTSASRAAGRG